jgi:hypothetical protein
MNKDVHKDALMNACISFGESLKAFIKDPKSGRAAHIAAQCLFDVRKLENAIAEDGSRAWPLDRHPPCREHPKRNSLDTTATCAVNEVTRINIIPPVHKEDL